MLITTFIAGARAQRSQHLAYIFLVAGKRAGRRLRRWRERIAQASRHRHDLAMLLADDRMLRDIGLTRADVRYAASGRLWTGSSRALTPAAVWREETSAPPASGARSCRISTRQVLRRHCRRQRSTRTFAESRQRDRRRARAFGHSITISPVMPCSAWVFPSAPRMSHRRSVTRPAATGTNHHSAL